MRSSVLLNSAFASLALASPLFHLNPRVYETDVVTVTETITVLDLGFTTLTEFPASTTSSDETIVTSVETFTLIPTFARTTTLASSSVYTPSSTPVASSYVVSSSSIVPSSTEVVEPISTSSAEVVTSTEASLPRSSSVVVVSSSEVASSSSVVVASSTTSAAASSSPTDFQSTVLYHHNIHRANHSAPDASYDSDLASYAATLAATCNFAHDVTIGGGGYGQNIADYGSTGDVESLGEDDMIAQAITDYWYNGEVDYFLSSYYGEATPDMSNFDAWGHFSQVVWVDSTSVGCAVQYCEAGTLFDDMAGWFSVCNYGSAGNVEGEYGTNVLEPLDEATVSAS